MRDILDSSSKTMGWDGKIVCVMNVELPISLISPSIPLTFMSTSLQLSAGKGYQVKVSCTRGREGGGGGGGEAGTSSTP